MAVAARQPRGARRARQLRPAATRHRGRALALPALQAPVELVREHPGVQLAGAARQVPQLQGADLTAVSAGGARSEEHTSELQSLMRISYAFFYLKKKK